MDGHWSILAPDAQARITYHAPEAIGLLASHSFNLAQEES